MSQAQRAHTEMVGCIRCHTLPALYPRGLHWYCATCVLLPVCAEGTHAWRAATDQGQWGCVHCGAVLASQPISDTPVPAPVLHPDDYYC